MRTLGTALVLLVATSAHAYKRRVVCNPVPDDPALAYEAAFHGRPDPVIVLEDKHGPMLIVGSHDGDVNALWTVVDDRQHCLRGTVPLGPGRDFFVHGRIDLNKAGRVYRGGIDWAALRADQVAEAAAAVVSIDDDVVLLTPEAAVNHRPLLRFPFRGRDLDTTSVELAGKDVLLDVIVVQKTAAGTQRRRFTWDHGLLAPAP